MNDVRLDIPLVTWEWLNDQPEGSGHALDRILGQSAEHYGGMPRIRSRAPAEEPPTSDSAAAHVASVYIMMAHMHALLGGLVERLGWDRPKALARERCRGIAEHPPLDCWKQIIAAVHELFQEHASQPMLPPEELLRQLGIRN